MKPNTFDMIGDVHGCRRQLLSLLQKLGHCNSEGQPVVHPQQRKLVLLGDLVDRGPDSAGVLKLVMQLCREVGAQCLRGNHDERLLRFLLGHPVNTDRPLLDTVAQIDKRGAKFRQEAISFLSSCGFIYRTPKVIMVHAAYRTGAHKHEARNLAIFGTPDGRWVEYPNVDWQGAYTDKRLLVHGHVPTHSPTTYRAPGGGTVINIDTGCVFGRTLTALRYPEMQFFAA